MKYNFNKTVTSHYHGCNQLADILTKIWGVIPDNKDRCNTNLDSLSDEPYINNILQLRLKTNLKARKLKYQYS